LVQAFDNMLSRGPFIPAIKAVIADETGEPAWRRVVPPMAELPLADEQRLLADFRKLAATLPAAPLAAQPASPVRAALRVTSRADR
jgi:4-hydroxy-tetrahydrodipicolinate synthase